MRIAKKAFRDLRRHHALDDAKANRLGCIAAGADIEMSVRRIVVAEPIPKADLAAEQMLQFVHAQASAGAGVGLDLKALIDEGRA